MENIRWKKVKLSPHTRDRIGLFARDYDRDLYLENNVWSPFAFETRAYPETEEKYAYFKFNQDQYADSHDTARDKAIEELEAREEARRQNEKKIIEQAALQKAQMEANKKNKEEDAMAARKKTAAKEPRPVEPVMAATPVVEPKPVPQPKPPKVTKLKIQNRKTLNALEELYFEALKYKIGK